MDHSRLRELVVTHCVTLGLLLVAYCLSLAEHCSSRCFSYLSRVGGLPPCGVFEAKESAVVIVGGDDDIGRTIALNFSELGYTVFTLHPVQHGTSAGGPTAKSSDTSSANLLYLWHKKKERSGHQWGLIAPILLDTSSGVDRARASETIRAYCETHSLQLVAFMSLLPGAGSAATHLLDYDPLKISSSQSTPKRHPSRGPTQALLWSDIVTQSIREPMVTIQDYVEMLSRASGRVILVSHYATAPGLSQLNPTLDGVQRSVSQEMSQWLSPHGIKLCAVMTGPLDLLPVGPQHRRPGAAIPWMRGNLISKILSRPTETTHRTLNSTVRLATLLYLAVAESLLSFAVKQDYVSQVLEEIVVARYPKPSYCIGIHPVLSRLLYLIPAPFRLLGDVLTSM